MVFSVKRLALPLGLTISLVSAFTPLGCGSSGEAFAPVGPTHGDAEVPAPVAQRLTACAREHRAHLESAEHSVSFDVELTNDGDVDSVAVKDSTLGDQDLEACMAGALRSLSADDLPMRHSGSVPRGPVAPESRAPLGQAQALTCLASPPCLLAVGLLIGAAYIAVQIYVHAQSQSSTAKPKPRTAPTATTMPTAVTVDDEGERCKKVKEECLDTCSDTALPTGNFGASFRKCMRACMGAKGCAF
jgi:hypothetical protein